METASGYPYRRGEYPWPKPGTFTHSYQGTGDDFYKQGQLLPENFATAAKEAGVDSGLNIRFQEDYDHSYFTMATFADDHVEHAAKYLCA